MPEKSITVQICHCIQWPTDATPQTSITKILIYCFTSHAKCLFISWERASCTRWSWSSSLVDEIIIANIVEVRLQKISEEIKEVYHCRSFCITEEKDTLQNLQLQKIFRKMSHFTVIWYYSFQWNAWALDMIYTVIFPCKFGIKIMGSSIVMWASSLWMLCDNKVTCTEISLVAAIG